MKKIFSLVAIAVVISFASCGGNASSNVAVEDSLFIDTVAVLDEPQTLENVANALTRKLESGDVAGIRTVIAQASRQVRDLINAGDAAAAAEYVSKIKEFVETNKAKIEEIAGAGSTALDEIMNAVQDLPSDAENAANEAVDTLKAAAGAAVESAKNAVEDVVNEAVESAKAKVGEKVDEAAAKATDAAGKAVDEAADKAKEALGL